MKLALAACLALLVPAPTSVQAQEAGPDQARCEAHRATITDTAKELSWRWAMQGSERTAVRAEVGLSEINLLATLIDAKITAMAADGCGGYRGPIGPDAYKDSVQRCRAANGARTDFTVTPPECDRSTWEPTSGAL